MATAYIMIGVPGVGKDTYIKEQHLTDNAIEVSSDKIRKELYHSLKNQGKQSNTLVFNRFYSEISSLIQKKQNVIVNATNLSLRRRIALYTTFKNKGYQVIALVGMLSYHELLERNRQRDKSKQVPENIIHKMYIAFTPPIIGLDCDNVKLFTPNYFKNNVNFNSLQDVIDSVANTHIQNELKLNYASHDCNPIYHTESIDEHINMVIYDSRQYDEEMAFTGVFHDLGKGVVKTHNGKYNVYYSHENYGSALAFNFIQNHQQFKDEQFVKYVQLHMVSFAGPFTQKTTKRYNLSEKDKEKLHLFNIIDDRNSIGLNN